MMSKRAVLMKNKRFKGFLQFEYGFDPNDDLHFDLDSKEDLYQFNKLLIRWSSSHCAVFYPELYPTEKQLQLIYSESLEGKRNLYADSKIRKS